MKTKFLMMLAVCFISSNLSAQKQITILLENGKNITSAALSIKKGSITADGVTYSKNDVLFVKDNDNGKMKIMNYKTGQLNN